MTRFKRRILLGVIAVVVALAAAGGWLYHTVYRSTYAAILNAEAFQFRRLQVARLEQNSYRFHFVTNRRQEPGDAPLEDRFGTERQDELSFGFFDTRIEPTLSVGMILDRTEWFQNEVIRLRDVGALDRTAFIDQVRERVEASPLRSLLVVVHGFREAFPSALRKTAFLSHVLDIDSPVLVFDWPGNQGSSLSGYRRAHGVARESGAELAQTLELIIREIEPEALWLLANSMGGQVVADAFSVLYQQADFADAETEITDVILTAPDVDREEFDSRFKEEMEALARHLTVYVSSNDRALIMSRIVNRARRQGESTLSPDMLDEAAKVVELVDPDSAFLTLVDVTPVNRTRNFHNFSLETPEFFDDLYLRLTNDRTPRSRALYKLETPEGASYWVLTRAR